MSRLQTSVVGLALVCLMTSCVPESKRPLSAAAAARPDKRLTGVWVGRLPKNEKKFWIHFVDVNDSRTEIAMILATEKGPGVDYFRMHPTTVGKRTYMNLKPYVPEEYASAEIAKEIKESNYTLAKYEVSGQTLKIWLMTKGIEKAVEEGELEGSIVKQRYSNDVTLTDSSENMAKFLEKADHAKIFELFMVCKKVEVELPAVEGF